MHTCNSTVPEQLSDSFNFHWAFHMSLWALGTVSAKHSSFHSFHCYLVLWLGGNWISPFALSVAELKDGEWVYERGTERKSLMTWQLLVLMTIDLHSLAKDLYWKSFTQNAGCRERRRVMLAFRLALFSLNHATEEIWGPQESTTF